METAAPDACDAYGYHGLTRQLRWGATAGHARRMTDGRRFAAMRELARITTHDMIAAFLRAELHSERFGTAVQAAMRRHRVPRRAVEHPDTADARQNAQRLAILRDYRRYGLDRSL